MTKHRLAPESTWRARSSRSPTSTRCWWPRL